MRQVPQIFGFLENDVYITWERLLDFLAIDRLSEMIEMKPQESLWEF